MKTYTKKIKLKTPREDFIDITNQVIQIIEESDIKNGHCVVYCPHTTAGITVNENADPDVVTDMLFALDKIYPNYPIDIDGENSFIIPNYVDDTLEFKTSKKIKVLLNKNM